MIDRAYRERPLIRDAREAPYLLPTQEHCEALSVQDIALSSPECGETLVCQLVQAPVRRPARRR
ncbi:MAG: hypothetical protein ACP5XB_22525 [Isosphaeraceae bacterium]